MARPDVGVMRELSDVCRWKTDPKIGRYFVPGCWGSAVYGESACTCNRKLSTADWLTSLEERVRRLEDLAAGRTALNPPAREGEGDQP
jgi:hypothetical protein